MNYAQTLKALGYLPHVKLSNTKTVTTKGFGLAVTNLTCGTPDKFDDDILDATEGALIDALECTEPYAHALKAMHTQLVELATGRGSIPPSCNAQYSGWHSMTYYVDRSTFNSHQLAIVPDSEIEEVASLPVFGTREFLMDTLRGKTRLDAALWLGDEADRRIGCAMIQVDEHDGAYVHFQGEAMSGSLKGYAYYNDKTCNDHVDCKIDTSSYTPVLSDLADLITHERGHNKNFDHTFSGEDTHHGIMSYSRKNPFVGYSTGLMPPYDRPVDPSIAVAVKYFGNEPVPPINPPPPPTTNKYTRTSTWLAACSRSRSNRKTASRWTDHGRERRRSTWARSSTLYGLTRNYDARFSRDQRRERK